MKLTIMPPIARASENCKIEKWKGGKCNIVFANLSTVLNTKKILSINYPLIILIASFKRGNAIKAPRIKYKKEPFETDERTKEPIELKAEQPKSKRLSMKSLIMKS